MIKDKRGVLKYKASNESVYTQTNTEFLYLRILVREKKNRWSLPFSLLLDFFSQGY